MKLVSTFAWMSFHSEGIKPYVKLEWYRKDPRYVDIWELVLQVLHRLLLFFVMVWWGGYHGFLFGARFAALFLGLLAMPHWVKGLWILCSTGRFRKIEMSGNFQKNAKNIWSAACVEAFLIAATRQRQISTMQLFWMAMAPSTSNSNRLVGKKDKGIVSHDDLVDTFQWYDMTWLLFLVFKCIFIYVSNSTNTCRCM